MRDALIEYFAQGHSKERVSQLVGVTQETLSAYLEDPDFATALANRKVELQQERVERRYNKLEESLLIQIEARLPEAEFPHLCRALESIAKNKVAYRNPGNNPAGVSIHNTINVMMPQIAENHPVLLNSKNEVVAVGDRMMAPMPITGVQKLFKELAKEAKDEHEANPNGIDLAELAS